MEKERYIKVTEPGFDHGFTVPLDKAKEELDAMFENAIEGDDMPAFTFAVVFMTEAEYDAMPEFQGF